MKLKGPSTRSDFICHYASHSKEELLHALAELHAANLEQLETLRSLRDSTGATNAEKQEQIAEWQKTSVYWMDQYDKLVADVRKIPGIVGDETTEYKRPKREGASDV